MTTKREKLIPDSLISGLRQIDERRLNSRLRECGMRAIRLEREIAAKTAECGRLRDAASKAAIFADRLAGDTRKMPDVDGHPALSSIGSIAEWHAANLRAALQAKE